jgi:hypothetical protein
MDKDKKNDMDNDTADDDNDARGGGDLEDDNSESDEGTDVTNSDDDDDDDDDQLYASEMNDEEIDEDDLESDESELDPSDEEVNRDEPIQARRQGPRITCQVTSIKIKYVANMAWSATIRDEGIETRRDLGAHETTCNFKGLKPNSEYTITCSGKEFKTRTKPRAGDKVTPKPPTLVSYTTRDIESDGRTLTEGAKRKIDFPAAQTPSAADDETSSGPNTLQETEKKFPALFRTTDGNPMPRKGTVIQFKWHPSPESRFVLAEVLDIKPVALARQVITDCPFRLSYILRIENPGEDPNPMIMDDVELDPDMHDWHF